MTRTVPSLALQNPGGLVTGALWNAGPKALTDFHTGLPLFRGRQTGAISMNSGVWYPMPLAVADVDTDSGHSNVTNNTRYVCQVAGWYWVEGYLAWTAAGAQSRVDAAIAYNGAIVLTAQQALVKPSGDYAGISASDAIQLAVGDYIEIWGRQNTGSALNTIVAGDLCPSLNALWMHS